MSALFVHAVCDLPLQRVIGRQGVFLSGRLRFFCGCCESERTKRSDLRVCYLGLV